MSISYVRNQIATLKGGIADLRGKMAAKSEQIAAKRQQAQRLADSITKSTSPTIARSKISSVNRLAGDIARLERDLAQLDKAATDKAKRLSGYEEQLERQLKDQERRDAAADKRRRDEQIKHEQRLSQAQSERERKAREIQRRLHAEDARHQHTLTEAVRKRAELKDVINSKMTEPKIYDVALSFAGEDRGHAEAMANFLKDRGISVFYDEFEQADLWGKNVYEHLTEVYRDRARFCVMFISDHYARKAWTNLERRSAQARAFREREEYILPIRLDDSEIPGLLGTVGYVSLGSHTIEEICDLLLAKLSTDSGTARSDDAEAVGE